ncbi:MAG: tetratricopeptide repeat protein [Candidatus Omnitrophica bacterium]|nr:tetratricopeptide repeat protein [Candidatus Omnitrophota bacterium]
MKRKLKLKNYFLIVCCCWLAQMIQGFVFCQHTLDAGTVSADPVEGQTYQSLLSQGIIAFKAQDYKCAQEMQLGLAQARGKGDVQPDAFLSDAKLDNFLNVLDVLGYDADAAARIAKPLFHLYNKFPFQGSLPVRKMRQQLEYSVREIQRDFITKSGQGNRINSEHARVYGLLLNSQSHLEFFNEFLQYYKVLSPTNKEYVDMAFQCSYKSYLGWIFLTAKGFKVVPVMTYMEKEQRQHIAEKNDPVSGLFSFAFSQGEQADDTQRDLHVSLIVELADNQYVYVDITNSFVSEPFTSDDYFCDLEESRCSFLLEGRGDIFRSILLIDQSRMRAVLYAYLSGFYSIAGEDQKALDCLDEALEFAPDFGYLYHKLGLYYYRKGEHDKVISFLKKSVEVEPYNDMFPFFLGRAYLAQGNIDSAMIYFERAILNYSRDPSFYEALAYVHTRKGEWPQAIRNYQTVINLDEEYPKAYSYLGMAYIKLGESQYRSKYYSKAQESFESALDCFKETGNQALIQVAQKALKFLR